MRKAKQHVCQHTAPGEDACALCAQPMKPRVTRPMGWRYVGRFESLVSNMSKPLVMKAALRED